MPSGPEMYDALVKAWRHVPPGGEFVMHKIESLDLQKLISSDLIARGFAPKYATEVCLDLHNEDFESFQDIHKRRFLFSFDAPWLCGDQTTIAARLFPADLLNAVPTAPRPVA